MSTRRRPCGSGAVEVATRQAVPRGSVGLVQAHSPGKKNGHEKAVSHRTWSSYGPTLLPIRALVLEQA